MPTKPALACRLWGHNWPTGRGVSTRSWPRICKTGRPALFSYQRPLRHALAPLQAEYGNQAIAALARIWQCEADEKRRPLPWPEKQKRQQIWQQSLDQAYALLGDSLLWPAWDALSIILSRSWRGSMLAECVNSLLRLFSTGASIQTRAVWNCSAFSLMYAPLLG